MEKNYLYADEKEQMTRANGLYVLTSILFYIFAAVIVFVAYLRGIRSLGFTCMIGVVVLVMIVLNLMLYRTNSADRRIRYVLSTGLLVITFFTGIAFDAYYLRFMGAVPFIICIVFFDRRYSRFYGVVTSALNIIITVIKISVLHRCTGDETVDQICATLVICFMMLLIYWTVAVAHTFNSDTIGQLGEEKKKQQERIQNWNTSGMDDPDILITKLELCKKIALVDPHRCQDELRLLLEKVKEWKYGSTEER